MPIYAYRCLSCSATFEARRSVAERDVTGWCDQCGAPEVDRVFTPTSQILVPAAFRLPMDWAGSGGEGTSLGGRSQIVKPRQSSVKEAFDAVKDWG